MAFIGLAVSYAIRFTLPIGIVAMVAKGLKKIDILDELNNFHENCLPDAKQNATSSEPVGGQCPRLDGGNGSSSTPDLPPAEA